MKTTIEEINRAMGVMISLANDAHNLKDREALAAYDAMWTRLYDLRTLREDDARSEAGMKSL